MVESRRRIKPQIEPQNTEQTLSVLLERDDFNAPQREVRDTIRELGFTPEHGSLIFLFYSWNDSGKYNAIKKYLKIKTDREARDLVVNRVLEDEKISDEYDKFYRKLQERKQQTD